MSRVNMPADIRALADLVFYCDGVTQTVAPPREIYNAAFHAIRRLENNAESILNEIRAAAPTPEREARRDGRKEEAPSATLWDASGAAPAGTEVLREARDALDNAEAVAEGSIRLVGFMNTRARQQQAIDDTREAFAKLHAALSPPQAPPPHPQTTIRGTSDTNSPGGDSHRADARDAARYRWLRSDGFWLIRVAHLTPDTSDVGLDAAIDAAIEAGAASPGQEGRK